MQNVNPMELGKRLSTGARGVGRALLGVRAGLAGEVVVRLRRGEAPLSRREEADQVTLAHGAFVDLLLGPGGGALEVAQDQLLELEAKLLGRWRGEVHGFGRRLRQRLVPRLPGALLTRGIVAIVERCSHGVGQRVRDRAGSEGVVVRDKVHVAQQAPQRAFARCLYLRPVERDDALADVAVQLVEARGGEVLWKPERLHGCAPSREAVRGGEFCRR